MSFLYRRAGRLTAKHGGFRFPWQGESPLTQFPGEEDERVIEYRICINGSRPPVRRGAWARVAIGR